MKITGLYNFRLTVLNQCDFQNVKNLCFQKLRYVLKSALKISLKEFERIKISKLSKKKIEIFTISNVQH